MCTQQRTGYGYSDLNRKSNGAVEVYQSGTFSEGVADVQYGDSALYGFMIRKKNRLSLQNSAAGAFREGLAPQQIRMICGFIDHTVSG